MTAQSDLGVQVAWRTERRHAARSHHPDLGGDAQEYLRVIASIDATYGLCVDPGGPPPVPTQADLGQAPRAAAHWWARRRLPRTALTRLPRLIPGVRRDVGP